MAYFYQCCVRVQVVKSESESESSPLGRDSGPESRFLSPSPSQSEKNWTRVRVRVNGLESESLLESHSTDFYYFEISVGIKHIFI